MSNEKLVEIAKALANDPQTENLAEAIFEAIKKQERLKLEKEQKWNKEIWQDEVEDRLDYFFERQSWFEYFFDRYTTKLPVSTLRAKREAGNKKYGDIAYNCGEKEFNAIDFYQHGNEELLDFLNYLALQWVQSKDTYGRTLLPKEGVYNHSPWFHIYGLLERPWFRESKPHKKLDKLLRRTARLYYDYQKLEISGNKQ